MKKISITSYLFFLLLSICLLNTNSFISFEEEISISQTSLYQGSFIEITAPLELSEAKVVFANNTYNFWLEEKKAIALIPVSYWLEPGEYLLSILDNQGLKLKEWSINLKDGQFDSSYLTVSRENREKVRPTDPKRQKRQEQERQLVYQARSTTSSKRLWTKDFKWPLEGRRTTGFGATRYHNGVLANRHNGIDIAAVEGTAIKAVNCGKVVLADNLLSTGKTIIIDHGWNVFSSYLHHSKLKVSVGDKVERGQVIALVGETGFATGPHLHWSMSIGRTFVNPEDFF